MPPDLEIYLSLLQQKILEDDDAIRELESEILKRQEAKRLKEMFVALLTKQQMAIENKDQLILELTQQINELQPTNEYKIGTGTLYPREGDYKAVVEWLERKKQKGEDFYVGSNYNRREMCRKLSKIFEWEVDESGVRKAQERLNKEKM